MRYLSADIQMLTVNSARPVACFVFHRVYCLRLCKRMYCFSQIYVRVCWSRTCSHFEYRYTDVSQYSLKKLKENGAYSRDWEEYKKNHYRGHWQPLCAIFGLFACTMVVLFSGWPAIYLLSTKRRLAPADKLKSNGVLVADLLGAYSSVSGKPPVKCSLTDGITAAYILLPLLWI